MRSPKNPQTQVSDPYWLLWEPMSSHWRPNREGKILKYLQTKHEGIYCGECLVPALRWPIASRGPARGVPLRWLGVLRFLRLLLGRISLAILLCKYRPPSTQRVSFVYHPFHNLYLQQNGCPLAQLPIRCLVVNLVATLPGETSDASAFEAAARSRGFSLEVEGGSPFDRFTTNPRLYLGENCGRRTPKNCGKIEENCGFW